MGTNRRDMTVRIVPLASLEAGESRVGGSVTERVALVSAQSASLWLRTGRALPEYTRASMPVLVTPLGHRPDRD